MSQRTRTWPALIVLVYFIVQLAGLSAVGLTDDDDFYIPAGNSYAEWLGRALTLQPDAWSRAGIDRAFEPNHEHPPFAKYGFGVSQAALRFLGPVDGARVGSILFSTLVAALLLLLALRHLGPRRGLWTGGLAVFFLLTLPRFYFHSHAATLDVPVAAMYLATVALALLGERSTKSALLAGPVFGLACATKLNAPFLLLGYLVFFLLTRRGRARAAIGDPPASDRASVRLPAVPLALLSMIAIGPLVFWMVWPWLWFDFTQRIVAYVGFHLNHYPIFFLYFGQVYVKDPYAPWHAPFVMAATTTPLVTLVLGAFGAWWAARIIRVRLRFTDGPDDDQRKEGDLWLMVVLQAFFAIATVAFSGGPKYGGEKLFTPLFPFLCLLAAHGVVSLHGIVRVSFRRKWVPAAVLGPALASIVLLQLRFGAGYALSEYNGLIGGLRGATAIGFERQYYDVAYPDLVAWLNTEAPQGLRVHFLPNNWEYVRTYNWYKRTGKLRNDLEVVDREALADWIVITHERRFSRYADDLRRFRTRPVLEERILDGAPLWSVVKAK